MDSHGLRVADDVAAACLSVAGGFPRVTLCSWTGHPLLTSAMAHSGESRRTGTATQPPVQGRSAAKIGPVIELAQ